jgi:hypothetical protein
MWSIFRKTFIFPVLLSGLLISCTCGHDNPQAPEPEPKYLHADAGPDLTSRVGQYVALDGSNSSADEGERIVRWGWDELPGNPERRYFGSGQQDTTIFMGYNTEGVYRFSLSVETDSGRVSNTDTVVVTVLPRNTFVFEDPSLEIHVRYWLKMPFEELTDAILLDADTVDCYRLSANKVTSLSGIEHCANLLLLGLGGQELIDISPLANLTKLKDLDLNENYEISDISPLAGLVNMEILDLEENRIINLSPLAGMTKMQDLRLGFNPIQDIAALADMKDLKELMLSNSPFGDISVVTGMPELEILWLSKCDITDITPVKNLTNLHLLFLSWNNINDISPIAGLTKLVRLYLQKNQITDISPLQSLVNINLLRLTDNQIEDILPLVNNPGIGTGDGISLKKNPLSAISINDYIPILRSRGATVSY